jgi:hypothetical protein
MDSFIQLWGEIRESWADMSVLIVALIGVVLAVIPGEVADLEKNPRWGRLWRVGIPLLLILVGVTGFVQGCQQKHDFQHQISQLTSQATIEATKEDVGSLRTHIDDGLSKVADAIYELGGKKGKKPTITPPVETPTPAVQHVRFSQRAVPSDKPEYPYGLQVVIQTDVQESRPALEIDFDGPIADDASFFVAGYTVMQNVTTTLSADRKSFAIEFAFPDWKPESPLVVNVKSAQAVKVVGVKKLH